MKTGTRHTRDVLAALLWGAMIFGLSSIPKLESGLPQDFFLRKVAHMAEFGIFALLLWRVAIRRTPDAWHARALAVFLALFYACSDETHQLFVLGRDGTMSDVVIDGAGILIGIVSFARQRRLQERQ